MKLCSGNTIATVTRKESVSRKPDSYMNRICANCGLTYGSHRADSTYPGQCPETEGGMDWPKTGNTTFKESGQVGMVPSGTPSSKGENVTARQLAEHTLRDVH